MTTALVCRFCIALYGLKAQDVAQRDLKDDAGLLLHWRQQHSPPYTWRESKILDAVMQVAPDGNMGLRVLVDEHFVDQVQAFFDAQRYKEEKPQ